MKPKCPFKTAAFDQPDEGAEQRRREVYAGLRAIDPKKCEVRAGGEVARVRKPRVKPNRE